MTATAFVLLALVISLVSALVCVLAVKCPDSRTPEERQEDATW